MQRTMRTSLKPTVTEIAGLAGVSVSTVSRVLNRSGYFSDETGKRVIEAARSLGYPLPATNGTAARNTTTRLIGLIIPDILNVLYTGLAASVLAMLRRIGHEMVLCVSDEEERNDRYYLEMLAGKGVDAIIYTHPAHGANSEAVRALVSAGIPVVELNRRRESDLLDAVLPNNELGVFQAVEHLHTLGHQRIGFINGDLAVTNGSERLAGYLNAVRRFGLDDDPLLVRSGSFTRDYGEEAAEALLTMGRPPTAILAGSNRLALGLLTVVGRHGLCIPDDLSVIAYNDAEWLAAWNPPITSVGIAVNEMAQLAVDLVVRRLQYGYTDFKPLTYHLSNSLIMRSSCRRIEGDSA
jgi:LacI family transcriptional regulator